MNPTIRKAVYLGAAVLALVAIVLVFVLGLQSRDKTAAIEIQSVVPNDPKITIDGNGVTTNGKVSVTPGTHKLVAKRNGFADKSIDVEAKAGETKTIRLLMDSNSDVGDRWLRDHPDAAAEWEGTVGKRFDDTSKTVTKENPLIAYLPEIHPTWRVDYGTSRKSPNDPDAVAIIITYGGSDIDKQNAIDWIKSLGFNPDNYEIIFQTPPQPGG